MTEQHDNTLMKDLSKPKTFGEYARIYLTGFAMGAADIVPGVSGGTMAFILGAYETLLNAIKSFNLEAIKLAFGMKFSQLFNEHIPVRFLVALGIGLLSAILLLSNALSGLLETQPLFIFAFFGGLILASIVSVGLKIKWSIGAVVALVVGAVFAFWIIGLPALEDGAHDNLTLFLSGMVAICAMLLPGISGSFILLILGQYKYILNAVKERDIVPLIFVALGCLVGILAFARVISWLLKHYESITIAALVGFMIGSLRVIVQEMDKGAQLIADFGAGHIVFAVVIAIGGFVLVSALDHMQTRSNPLFAIFQKRAS